MLFILNVLHVSTKVRQIIFVTDTSLVSLYLVQSVLFLDSLSKHLYTICDLRQTLKNDKKKCLAISDTNIIRLSKKD